MAQLSADDKTRLTTKLEGLRARVVEIEGHPGIAPESKREMVSVRKRQIANIEEILNQKVEAPK